MTFLFKAQDKEAFMIIKASFPSIAKKKARDRLRGTTYFNWEVIQVPKKEAKRLCEVYELNTIYAN